MKKKFITAVFLMALTMCAVGCGSKTPTMSMEIPDEKTAEITLNKADPDDFLLAGSIEVADGESIEIVPEIEDGSEVSIELIAASEEQSADKLPEIGEADFDVILNSNDEITCVVDPGSYMLKVTALTKSNGTISLQVMAAEVVEESMEDMDEADALVPVEDELAGSEDVEP